MRPAEIINLGNGLEIHFSLDAAETNDQFTLFKVVIHPGAKVPAPHFHENFDETLYGLKGRLTLTVDDQTFHLQPGDCFFIKRGRVHSFVNDSGELTEILAYANPGVFTANYFKDVLELTKTGMPPDMASLQAIMQSYGLVPV